MIQILLTGFCFGFCFVCGFCFHLKRQHTTNMQTPLLELNDEVIFFSFYGIIVFK